MRFVDFYKYILILNMFYVYGLHLKQFCMHEIPYT